MSLDSTLELDVKQARVGEFLVHYAKLTAFLDVQEAVFAAYGLHMVSPAELGFLRVTSDEVACGESSLTSAEVLYDPRDKGQTIILPNSTISLQVGVANVGNAHRKKEEYFIPLEKRVSVYALVDMMLKNGTAVNLGKNFSTVSGSEFETNPLTSLLFSDARLGIQAKEYGTWVRGHRHNLGYPLGQALWLYSYSIDDGRIFEKNGPCLNRLLIYNFGDGNLEAHHDWASGRNRYPGDHHPALGVRFERVTEGAQKNE